MGAVLNDVLCGLLVGLPDSLVHSQTKKRGLHSGAAPSLCSLQSTCHDMTRLLLIQFFSGHDEPCKYKIARISHEGAPVLYALFHAHFKSEPLIAWLLIPGHRSFLPIAPRLSID